MLRWVALPRFPAMTASGISWAFISVERLDPSDRFVLGRS
jgi:hypothetical protein